MAQEADLITALQEQDQAGRLSTLEQLVQEGSDAAVGTLAGALIASNWPLCDDLADALVRIGTEAALFALVQALKARRHHVRSAAIRGLVQIGDRIVCEDIAKLTDDPSYEVRVDARRALSELGPGGSALRSRRTVGGVPPSAAQRRNPRRRGHARR